MLPIRDSKDGEEGEGRMVGQGAELGLGRVGATVSTSMVTGSAWWCRCKLRWRYRCSYRVSFRCRCRCGAGAGTGAGAGAGAGVEFFSHLSLLCIPCIVYSVLCTVFNVQYIVYSVQCTVNCIPCTVYSVQCTMEYVLFLVYCVLGIVYCLLCTVYSIQCTVFNELCTLSLLSWSLLVEKLGSKDCSMGTCIALSYCCHSIVLWSVQVISCDVHPSVGLSTPVFLNCLEWWLMVKNVFLNRQNWEYCLSYRFVIFFAE